LLFSNFDKLSDIIKKTFKTDMQFYSTKSTRISAVNGQSKR